MADEPTLGEVWRRLDRHEEQAERERGEIHSRITELAANTVPLETWRTAEERRSEALARLERDHDEDLATLRRTEIEPLGKQISDVRKSRSVRWGWVVTWATLGLTAIGVLIAAWSAATGSKS